MTSTPGGTRPSNSKASQRRRLAIEEATRTLLRSQDAAKIAVADIAEEAEVSIATIYNLVGTRDQLLANVLDSYATQLAAVLGDEPTHTDDPEAATIAVITAACDTSLEDPLPLRAVLRELGPLNLAETKGDGIAGLLAPRLIAAGAAAPAAHEAARLIVYAYRGALISWAHGLIDDTQFRADSELAARRLVTATLNNGNETA